VGLLNTIAVKVDPTGLSPKIYTGQITISAPGATNKTLALNVTLTVKAALPVVTGTWPAGVIVGSPASIATVVGSSFYPNSTSAAVGFTPASTITVNDGASTATETFFIPVYQASATALRLAIASPLPGGTVGVGYASSSGCGRHWTLYLQFVRWRSSCRPIDFGGAIAGTPTAAGPIWLRCRSPIVPLRALIAFGQLKLTIDPAGTTVRTTIAAAPLILGVVASAYGPVTLTAAGGTGGPYTWSATNLPAGLVLSSAVCSAERLRPMVR
jgi:hypothetical protein